jgi:dephospho-CoA kinase
MDEFESISNAINYINANKKEFLEQFTLGIEPNEEKIAIFTAGMSGVGKTEFGQFLKENNSNLLHIDTDKIRDYFKIVGYDGQNAHIFQKPASKGFSKLFDYAIKNNLSLILDSNLSNLSKAIENIERLLNKNYKVEIFYIYNEPTVCFEYAIKREVITNRKVPYNIFVKSNIDSYKTVIELKNLFKNKIVLNFIDKRDDTLHQDINIDVLKQKIGENFDIK